MFAWSCPWFLGVKLMTGLMPLILAMIRVDPMHLAAADHRKLAAKYEIAPDVARHFLKHWTGR